MLARETGSDKDDTNSQALAAGSARVSDSDCRDGVLQRAAPGGPVRTPKRPFAVETGCSCDERAASFFLLTRSYGYSPIILRLRVVVLTQLEMSREPLCARATTGIL